jgi:hypothetical protein
MRIGEILVSAGMALLAVLFYSLGTFTQEINPDDPGPAFYPRSLAVLLFCFSFAQMVLSWRAKEERHKEAAKEAKSSKILIIGTLLLSVAYGIVFDKVSYLLTTTCFLLAMMLLGGARRWLMLLSVAVCYSLSTYFLFNRVLMVPLK